MEFDINGKVTVSFSPIDTALRVVDAIKTMDRIQTERMTAISTSKDVEIYDIVCRFDDEASTVLNGIFEINVCAPVFGSISVFQRSNGSPVWANFLFALLDKIGADAKLSPRNKKIAAKYRKKYFGGYENA